MKILIFIICLIAAASLFLNVKLIRDRKITTQPTYKVLEVIDGDTFKIENDRRVRLMGINTPELGKCLSSQAKEKLSGLTLGKDVTLTDQFSDPYGRIMANVFVGKDYLNKEMLLSGFARMDYYENPHKDELKKAYAEAREKKQY